MFYGISEGLMSRLQSVQNAAARLVSGARRYDHITPVLQELYWLPVRRRVDFKMSREGSGEGSGGVTRGKILKFEMQCKFGAIWCTMARN